MGRFEGSIAQPGSYGAGPMTRWVANQGALAFSKPRRRCLTAVPVARIGVISGPFLCHPVSCVVEITVKVASHVCCQERHVSSA